MRPALVDAYRQTGVLLHPIEVQHRVEEALQAESHLLNRPISCHFHEGTLVLRGNVACYYHKQIAQTVAAGTTGVEQVINQLVVSDGTTSDG